MTVITYLRHEPLEMVSSTTPDSRGEIVCGAQREGGWFGNRRVADVVVRAVGDPHMGI